MDIFSKIIVTLAVSNRIDKEKTQSDESLKFLELMRKILGKYSTKDIEDGVMSYIESEDSKYDFGRLPQIGTLVTHIHYASRQNREQIELNANIEFSKIMENVRRGIYRSDCPIVCSAVRAIGGWESFRMMLETDESWKRKAFVAAYLSSHERDRLITQSSANDPPLENDKKTLQMLKDRINAKKLTVNS